MTAATGSIVFHVILSSVRQLKRVVGGVRRCESLTPYLQNVHQCFSARHTNAGGILRSVTPQYILSAECATITVFGIEHRGR